jgi:competence protein ComEA
MTTRTYPIARRAATLVALAALLVSVTTTLGAARADAAPSGATAAAKPASARSAAAPAVDADEAPPRTGKKAPTGKLNLNTANEDQLQLLPGVGPAKAERIVTWRKKNGAFKRVADLRKVKGFGYKTLRKLEPWLEVKGDTTLAAP